MTTHTTSYSSYSSSAKTSGGGALTGNYSYRDSSDSSKEEIVVKNSDMSDSLRNDAISVTKAAFDKFTVEKDIAAHIKKTFDDEHGAAWHCIVGKNFGSYVTHETGNFIYCESDKNAKKSKLAVLLFKSG